jgi:diguanylate cyclase (GGDEF)-like protein
MATASSVQPSHPAWTPAPLPSLEDERLAGLRALEVLDTAAEPEFDALVRAAAHVCGTPIALVSLVDARRQWFKANLGLSEAQETPRDVAFCSHAILEPGLFQVKDAAQDARFAGNPLVVDGPRIRFYAGAPIRLKDGQAVGTLCVIDRRPRQLDAAQRDVLAGLAQAAARALEGRQASRQLVQRVARPDATHDALTGLVGRDAFYLQLQQGLKPRPADSAAPLDCLLFLDLDHFRIVNDNCGHAFGDRLLAQMADLLRASVRTSDVVGRLDGDEFAILLKGCPLEVAHELAQKFCNRLESHRFEVQGKRFRIGASMGLAQLNPSLIGIEALMRVVEGCSQSAKSAGGNRVVTWPGQAQAGPATDTPALWVERIGRALDEDRFVLMGQLQVPLQAKAGGLKVEILLRMQGESGELIPPSAFMPAAERFHLMGRIDRWVLRHTLAWMHSHASACSAQRYGINLSGQSVGDPDFHAWALAELQAAGPTLCAALTLEITETVAIAEMAEAAAFLRAVRTMGLHVALDDFGSGAATFGYLKQLPLDYLKIDGQFVTDLLTDPLDEVSVRSFVDVARVMGIQTIAEFVESAAVMKRLRELGVDFAQGYHLHRPAPLDTLCNLSLESREERCRPWPSAQAAVPTPGPDALQAAPP